MNIQLSVISFVPAAVSSQPRTEKPQRIPIVASEETDVILEVKSIKSTAWLLIKPEQSEDIQTQTLSNQPPPPNTRSHNTRI